MKTKKIRFYLSIIIITIFIIVFETLFAYEFTADFKKGIYWQNFPIQMKKFYTSEVDKEQLEPMIDEIENIWENSVGADIWNTGISSDADTKNIIRWSNNFGKETSYDPYNTLAVTVRYQINGVLDHVEIILNGNLLYLRENYNNILKITLLHEFGHTIGLDHTSNPAIMQAYLGDYETLQSDDIEGGIAIYEETVHRQATGYLSELASNYQKQEQNVSCATITTDVSDNEKGNKDGRRRTSLSILFSLFLGLTLTILLNYLSSRKFIYIQRQ